ncbi:hypothetical protein MNBD_NITROSPIRAE01-632 [hydrothermal vent metagenome]|uniref:J domain-containing protein n=1 Tax=hydrothermal vent metagenome TaxID=652676 RepID=A0A3B1CY33_9ZZZZ
MPNKAAAVENLFRPKMMIQILSKKSESIRPCWNCQSDNIAFYNCGSCTSIQQFLHDTDYFTLFNIGYKLSVDPDVLEKQYYELSRRFHPDYYQQRSKAEQDISLENTALLNTAYQTLQDPLKKTTYLLRLIEGDEALPTQAPAELFEEIFEIQENLETLRDLVPSDTDSRTKLAKTLCSAAKEMTQFQAEENAQLKALFLKWDALETQRRDNGFSAAQKELLTKMKQILSHAGYLERILQDIKTALQ